MDEYITVFTDMYGISEDDRRIIENTKRKLRFVEPKIL